MLLMSVSKWIRRKSSQKHKTNILKDTEKNPTMLENVPHNSFPDDENKCLLHPCPPIPEDFKSEAWLEV